MSIIHKLSPALCNQIAAGEVVERPANIIKELIENSIDANATQIRVDIEQGGLSCIKVYDDGVGIPHQSLPLVFERNATSKITSFEDIYAIHTLGFRGEALASIAAVSECTVTSSFLETSSTIVQNQQHSPLLQHGVRSDTYSIHSNYGVVGEVTPTQFLNGTNITVEHLFFNTPVRLKFLKNPATEQKRCAEIFARIALAHTDIAWQFSAGKREVFHFAAQETLLDKVQQLWPSALCTNLFHFHESTDDITVHGLASDPTVTQKRADKVLLYVNNRFVYDKLLLRAIREAYSKILTHNEYPQIVLFLELPPNTVDVNVHPAKTEIRFRDEQYVIRSVITLLQKALRHYVGYETLSQVPTAIEQHPSWVPNNTTDILSPRFTPLADTTRDDVNNHTFVDTTVQKELPYVHAMQPVSSQDFSFCDNHTSNTPLMHTNHQALIVASSNSTDTLPYSFLYAYEKTYLFFKHTVSNTILILDQHAVHERILEYYFTNMLSCSAQVLVLPLSFSIKNVDPERIAAVLSLLERCGFSPAIQKESHLLSVHALPLLLQATQVKHCIHGLLYDTAEKNLPDLLHKKACTHAIKAGDLLSTEDAYHLLTLWLNIPDNTHCPHGRPVAIELSLKTLHTFFKRTV